MRKIKLFFIEFLLFVYTKYIKEDWDIYEKWAKPYVYVCWLWRAVITWLVSPIFLPEFLFKRTSLYKKYKKIKESPEYTSQILNMMHTK